ncbi:MAG: glycerate kinase [Ignavibacteriaceae bacterium]
MSKKSKILIAPNSFKECSDSVTIAKLIRDSLTVLKNAELISKPISDGGDGFLNVCRYYFGGEMRKYFISTTYDESIFKCPVLYIESRKEIYIESAEVLGLRVVPVSYRNPLKLSSKGLGELLLKLEDDAQKGKIEVEMVYIGIGGTATIDMGIGMMAELGLKLLNSDGKELNVIPGNFHLAKRIEYKPVKSSFKIVPLVDVTNSLLGEEGGIQVFGRQKGASEDTISILEKDFNHLLNLFEYNGLVVSSDKLSGAGGGIPAAFQIFYKTYSIHSSIFIMHHLGIEKYLDSVDYLITGEGAYDHQSNSGKGAGVLIETFSSSVKTIFLVCGKISKDSISCLPKNVIPIRLNRYFENQSSSIANYQEGLKKACSRIFKELNF